MIDLRILAFGALGALAVAACSLKTTVTPGPTALVGTKGKGGKMGFSYAGLAKSCLNVDCAMMPGTRELIVMDPNQPLDAVIESGDPSVMTIDSGGQLLVEGEDGGIEALGGIHINALRAGTAEFRVKKASGEVVDTIDLVIETPARIALAWGTPDGGPNGTDSATVKVGSYVTFGATAYGANGQRLEATTGWTFSGDAPAVARVEDACVFICLAGDTAFRVTGVAAGTVHASASGGGTTGTATVEVTP